MSKDIITITKARQTIFDLAEEAQQSGVVYTLTERGLPKAVLMGAETFAAFAETLDVLQEFPHLAEDIQKAEKDLKKGRTESLERILIKEGYVRSTSAKSGPKRSRKT